MKSIHKLFSTLTGDPGQDPFGYVLNALLCLFGILCTGALFYAVFHSSPSYASDSLPGGDDAMGKLQAAATLLHILDTGIFKWGARIFAGLCIMSSAWSLKEQRFGIAVICVIGAIIFGTATKWVKNVFDLGGGDSVFSVNTLKNPSLGQPSSKLASLNAEKEGPNHG